MCLIIQKPAGKTVPQWILKSASEYNPDGVGILYVEQDTVQVRKWLNIKPVKLGRKLNRLQDVEVAIHFRMTTHGKTNTDNIHPFPVAGNRWLMHNGVLHKHTPALGKHAELSDTRCFIRDFLNPLIAV